VFLLAGSAMSWLRFVVQRAADLQPSILVLDDVDLIAEDRNLGGMSPRRHLFDLLDSMDGLHDDIDVLFVCTTNRPEALEKAIAARPGRVDHAVEVSLPDADCRRRLFELYGNGLDLELSDLDALVERTNGVTASFVKELLRRAAVIALAHDREGTGITVTDAHVHAGLDALLDPSNPLTASLLGGVGRRTETDSDAKETS
jgi:ATP-dependent 26S proteasome regulatory subunit